jgi:uncharacterized protein (TIGR03663 family)
MDFEAGSVRESKSLILFVAGVLLVAAAAAAIRLPRLAQRPMHGDEAIHAQKFATLLQDGQYIYDPFEYHGPTLNYFTLIPAWLRGQHTYQAIDEWTVRLVPVAFGVGLVLLVLGVADGLGRAAALAVAVLTAISHAMVFYSRYYIQEMLLVFFTFALIVCGWRYVRSRRGAWAIAGAVMLAFMHATKETFVIAVAAIAAAAVLTLFLSRRRAEKENKSGPLISKRRLLVHLSLAALILVMVSAVLFSCAFRNPRGIVDSVLTFKTYLGRGAGHSTVHSHPWYYYLHILGWYRLDGGPLWTEALILLLGVIGLVAAFAKKGAGKADYGFLRFTAFYAIFMTVAYSLIPYKTPWCLLGFLHAWILLAAVGTVVLLRLARPTWVRVLVALLLLQGGGYLLWQAYLGTYRYYDDHANPYVYAHTGSDVFTIAARVDEMAALHPDGKKMFIEVICPGADYWPLPWYLRAYENVGYYSEVDMTAMPAPVIIGYASLEKEILTKLFTVPPPGQRHTPVPLFDDYVELRPTIELRGYVPHDLVEGRLKAHAEEGGP